LAIPVSTDRFDSDRSAQRTPRLTAVSVRPTSVRPGKEFSLALSKFRRPVVAVPKQELAFSPGWRSALAESAAKWRRQWRRRRAKRDVAPFVYAGVAVMKPELFAAETPLVPFFYEAAKEGRL
jgi:hypothetical protein